MPKPRELLACCVHSSEEAGHRGRAGGGLVRAACCGGQREYGTALIDSDSRQLFEPWWAHGDVRGEVRRHEHVEM